MKFGVLFLLSGVAALSGCGSQNTTGPLSATATPTPRAVASQQTPTATSLPAPTAAATLTVTLPLHATGYDKGKAYLRARNYAAAATQFLLAVKRGDHVADSYAGIGTADLEQGKYADSYGAYKAAAARQPKNGGYIYYAAYSALYAQQFHDAVAYASRFIQLYPRRWQGYHLRFLAYGKLLQHKQQVQDAQMYVKLEPHKADSYNDLGIALTNDGKYARSIQAFSQAVRLNPGYVPYYTNRALAEDLNRQPNQVLRDLYTARSLAKDTATRNQIDRAINAFKKQMKH